MTNSVCPYCRAPVEPFQDEQVICEGCDTPHHRDCYQENGGCTVFGCRCAPPDEPKVRVSAPELIPEARPNAPATQPQHSSSLSILGLTGAAPSGVLAGHDLSSTLQVGFDNHKNKMTFVMLGVLLGALGAHNFYAGYKKKAIAQLCITVLTLGYGAPMSWIWAIIDVLTVEKDSEGIQFKS
jgi:TM2 domain-containing membrane protein YozV